MDSAIKKLMSEDLGKKFLVWNLSGEDKFNGSRLADQVMREREFFIDNLLVRIHFIIVMIRWTGLAPWRGQIQRFPPRRSGYNHSTEMCSGSEAGSYLRRIDSCIIQLKAQGPSRTCNESKEEEEEPPHHAVQRCPPSNRKPSPPNPYPPNEATKPRTGQRPLLNLS